MSFASEFKEFAMKGSVLDLAVGVVIGAAFGNVNFSELALQIATNAAGKPVRLKYGSFLQTIFEFLVIAFSIFVVIRGINKLKRPPPAAANAPPPPPSKSEVLLQEIRDLLAKR